MNARKQREETVAARARCVFTVPDLLPAFLGFVVGEGDSEALLLVSDIIISGWRREVSKLGKVAFLEYDPAKFAGRAEGWRVQESEP